ncbi:SusC/RagA family TonB-linked outer membrane protein [Chitinophaga pendula]|uniref:SusC/RagA family TonB-linked outer membrane protein n=1 Tax=Chitinophaga TaxID=79328 RepID=UPI0012FE36EC|nr:MULTISPECIES: SusC/RagA family TonB-linked outer membrane protein [Chitinophaga]UCJ04732.1 SusC/RagA family TonB-linked outer membrane protein [Chitinophaga pendula]
MIRKYAAQLFLGLLGPAMTLPTYASPPRQDTIPVQRIQNRDSVPVLFGIQSAATLLQAQGSIGYGDIRGIPVTQLENSLYGKLAGLYLFQFNHAPGFDAAAMSVRGQAPLVVIDGVPRSALSIDPEQIASVTVLKDALATAMYGMRGSGGVVMVNTKHGYSGKKRISFTAQSAIQQQLKTPRFLKAYDYARLYNEALQNDGKQPIYSATDLAAWQNGSDPFGHPDVDWYNTAIKDQAAMQRYNLNIAGGNRISRYFVDLDYLNQQGYFVTDPNNKYPTNNFYKRYIFRSNLDVDLTRTTLMTLSLFGRIRNGNEPGATTAGVYSSILGTPNNAYPVFNNNGSLGGNNDYSNNIYGQIVRSGYRPSYNRNLMVDLSLRQKLDTWLPGLYVKGTASFNSYYEEAIDRKKSFAVYNVKTNPVTGETNTSIIGSDGAQSNGSSITAQNRQAYTELSLGYDSTFGQHHLGATLLWYRDSYTNGNVLPLINSALSARIKYDYAQRYLLELAMSYSANNMYRKDKRKGYFPAIGLGWNIAKENWWIGSPLAGISTLKLRASYGRTGNTANAGYYNYLQFYATDGNYPLGNPPTSITAIREAALANPYITWEKAGKLNIGLDIAFAKERFHITVDHFRDQYKDLLMQRGINASSIIGNDLPRENIGATSYRGWEASAAWRTRTGDLSYFIQANGSVLKSRTDDIQEVIRPGQAQKRTGMPVGQLFGLVADGFYASAEDIQTHARPDAYSPVPGDIKYVDQNGDGIIDLRDETAIGSTKPLIYYGATIGLTWKGIDLSMVWQGVKNRDIVLNGSNTWEFQNGGRGQAMEHHLDRWTPATAATASYPRLAVGANPNNQRLSSFWVKDGSYLRLKNLELGYTLPAHWIKFARLQTVRAFANGYNLLTFTGLDRVDPESYQGGYPNQRVFNIGVNVQL